MSSLMHTKINLQSTIEQIIEAVPTSVSVFEKIGIDYCCGGKTTLEKACVSRGVIAEDVLKALFPETIADNSFEPSQIDFEKLSLTELANHIEQAHHKPLWNEIDRVGALVAKVVRVHGPNDPRLGDLFHLYSKFAEELSDHMRKEESILFPLIKQIENSEKLINAHCGSISNPLRQMKSDHDQASADFETIRQLTDDYTPPETACYSYRAMLTGLADMESDLKIHMWKESSILFPKSIEMEKSKS